MHVRISRVKMSGNGSGAPCECLCQLLMTIWREQYQHVPSHKGLSAVSGATERLFQRQRIDAVPSSLSRDDDTEKWT
jgi:hypothetical protein